ncbi:putative secreted protein [Propionispora sp. 2/2-37]|uniref:hypothetical protein n=1 Tax=Propionispora sp. 2/2-37 TaxID=1677858 RepID=UPI0006BB6DA3|nr:hypothetical protein [Propionispora sp. 2/2-37]CUH96000.1 putative secreted protein [Propionispora sp. 2/2-37]
MKRIIRKLGEKKYKRLLAAVAGAAVVSSAMLPSVYAAEGPGRETQVYERSSEPRDTRTVRVSDPVQEVRDNASTFGFNVNRDRFSLLSVTRDKATVQIRSAGKTYKVDLNRSGNGWVITTIRGIGNSNQAATYVPANLFDSYTASSPAASQLILYQNTNFDGWQWLDQDFDPGIGFGMLLTNPRSSGTTAQVPDSVLNQIGTVDFSKQFVIYTHLAGVPADGYGIAISKVVQTGNDFTVTVRTKSPQADETASVSQTDSWVLLDRSFLNFRSPIVVTFVNPAGAVLSTLTLTG